MPHESLMLEVNGIRVHTVTVGEGPAVVLLHGFPDTHMVWRKQIGVARASRPARAGGAGPERAAFRQCRPAHKHGSRGAPMLLNHSAARPGAAWPPRAGLEARATPDGLTNRPVG